MQVTPVSSIDHRLVRPKRPSVGETESERQTQASQFQIQNTVPAANAVTTAPRLSSAALASAFDIQLQANSVTPAANNAPVHAEALAAVRQYQQAAGTHTQ